MKTKSIMLIAVSLGFGLIAAIGMSQVLGQKGDGAPEVEMKKIFVALEPLEIGDELDEEKLKVQKRPATDVPENAITSLEQLENMVVIQKVPKDLMIVTDFICDKNEAKLKKQPPRGMRAYTIKTELQDTHHNSIQAGDRVDVVGIFKYRDKYDEEFRRPSTFLKNIEVWQVNDKDKRDVAGDDESKSIKTITVLLTPQQVETILLAEDVASMIRLVMTSRENGDESDDDFDLASELNGNSRDKTDSENTGDNEDQSALLKDLQTSIKDDDSSKTEAKKEEQYEHKMIIYRGGQAVTYGFADKKSYGKVIDQSEANSPNEPAPTETIDDDSNDNVVDDSGNDKTEDE